ncbi:MAG: delta-60 repeat domain-containing protein [Deltaproteobacteria bacterium]|nr:delta-60 repeat domain-containing protein [Deltaproteobacteria bacterium]
MGLDLTFNPNANNEIYSIAVQSDGKIIVGGAFTTIGGVTRNYIARLNSDGSLDVGFNPNLEEQPCIIFSFIYSLSLYPPVCHRQVSTPYDISCLKIGSLNIAKRNLLITIP